MHEFQGDGGDEPEEGREGAAVEPVGPPGEGPQGDQPLVPWSAQRDAWIAEQAVERYVWDQHRASEAAQSAEDAAVLRARLWSRETGPGLLFPDLEPGGGVGPPDDEDDTAPEVVLLDPPPGWTAQPGRSPDDLRRRVAELPGHAWGRARWGRPVRGSGYARPLLQLGAPGTGKSRAAAAHVQGWEGPVFVVSAKADLLDWTHAARSARGPVHVLDPAGVTANRYETAGFDLLRYARDLDGAGVLVSAMSAWRYGSDVDKDFWVPLGAALNQAVCFACARTGRSVAEWHRMLLEDDERGMRKALEEAGSDHAFSLFAAYSDREERNRSSVQLTARQQLRALDSPAVQRMLSGHDVDPARLLPDGQEAGEQISLFLTVPVGRVEALGSLVPLLVDLVINAALEREAVHGPSVPPLLVVHDEVAALGLARLPRWADLCRSSGVQLLVVAQSLSTLASAFGPVACDQVLGSSDVLLLGGGRCPRTAQLLATAVTGSRVPLRAGGRGAYRGSTLLRELPRRRQALLLTDAEPRLVRLPRPA